jgi:hypothetical protein
MILYLLMVSADNTSTPLSVTSFCPFSVMSSSADQCEVILRHGGQVSEDEG